MKLFRTFITLIIMMFSTSVMLPSCSDDDSEDNTPTIPEDVPDEPEKPEDEVPGIPQEYMEKIRAIYGASHTGPQEIKTISTLSILTSISSTIEGCGPISATPATLNGESITLVTLGGTQNVEGQATTMQESQLASMGKPNDYLTAVTNLFSNGTIPSNKPVIVSGYSLGGMIAQQICGVKEITDNFNIRAIITFGSPITLPLNRNGIKVVRFADNNDGVPRLGETMLRSGIIPIEGMTKEEMLNKLNELDKQEKISRTSKYTDFLITHALSYIEDECWNDIDFLGDKEKKNSIVLKEKMQFYHAPKTKK